MLPNVPRDEIKDIFRSCLLIRRFEESLIGLHREGESFGHFHVYIGEEVTGAVAMKMLRPDDKAFTTHRNHGHLLARGADPGRLLAEIMGKATGYNKGKGGTLHALPGELGFLQTSAVVGGVIPLAAGAAYASKQMKKDFVSICLFGDGALEEGAASETFNIAALWSLPVIFLCENNSLGLGERKSSDYSGSTNAARHLNELVTPYGIPCCVIDGTDAAAVHQAMSEALARARAGNGPTFIEAQTYRWAGSKPLWPDLLTGITDLTMAWDKSKIPQEHQQWHEKQDPVLRISREILEAGHLSREEILELDSEVRSEIGKGVLFAKESALPDPQSAFENIFA